MTSPIATIDGPVWGHTGYTHKRLVYKLHIKKYLRLPI